MLSLAHCPTAILVDDELNILPTSSHIRSIAPVATNDDGSAALRPGHEAAEQLSELAQSLTDTQPAGALTSACRSLDQAKALLTFLDVASDKVLRSTVALTAARGRGKSAAMGLAIAGAVALGYSNIFVTAPTPENLRTLFEFVFKGLDALDYKEHLDYDLVESTNPEFGKAIVRVNIYRSHRQVCCRLCQSRRRGPDAPLGALRRLHHPRACSASRGAAPICATGCDEHAPAAGTAAQLLHPASGNPQRGGI